MSTILDLLWPIKRSSYPNTLIYSPRALSCIDPRDRVYGILSLLSVNFKYNQRSGYSLKTEDIYKAFFLAELDSYAIAWFDQARGNGCSKLLGGTVPSWVPDLAWHGGGFPISRAAANSAQEMVYSSENERLTIPGVHVATVSYVGPAVLSGTTPYEVVQIVCT